MDPAETESPGKVGIGAKGWVGHLDSLTVYGASADYIGSYRKRSEEMSPSLYHNLASYLVAQPAAYANRHLVRLLFSTRDRQTLIAD
jgi:hypothetical protein